MVKSRRIGNGVEIAKTPKNRLKRRHAEKLWDKKLSK